MPATACPLLGVGQVANQCAVTRFSVRRWLTLGVRGLRLRGTMMGGTWRIYPADLEAFLAELTRRAMPAEATEAPARHRTPEACRRRSRKASEDLARRGW